ncbi:MAG: glycosyltransferase [Anaerolineae bacterium]|nr:glycosyltransferase [Anaerolineae bacterium]
MRASTGVRVLQVGAFLPGSDCVHFWRAFQAAGVVARPIADERLFPEWGGAALRAARRLILPLIRRAWNERLLAEVHLFRPDLVFISNGHYAQSETLNHIRAQGIPLMCFYHDAELYPNSPFMANLPHYDLIASTCGWHRERFLEAGAKAVMTVRYGFDPEVHQPVRVSTQDRAYYGSDAVFVGSHWVPRARAFEAIFNADSAPRLTLWGGRWDQLPPHSPLHPCWRGREAAEPELPIIYGTAQAAIQYPKRDPDHPNRDLRLGDQHNPRTFQIAACGGAILVATRTSEHQAFFEEDQEAVFFDSPAELRQKLIYWTAPAQESSRRQMASAARSRCLSADYSYAPVIRQYLDFFSLGRS